MAPCLLVSDAGRAPTASRGWQDCLFRGKPITLSGTGARVLAVGRDHPATTGAVITFVRSRRE